jgi:hypothetical protein
MSRRAAAASASAALLLLALCGALLYRFALPAFVQSRIDAAEIAFLRINVTELFNEGLSDGAGACGAQRARQRGAPDGAGDAPNTTFIGLEGVLTISGLSPLGGVVHATTVQLVYARPDHAPNATDASPSPSPVLPPVAPSPGSNGTASDTPGASISSSPSSIPAKHGGGTGSNADDTGSGGTSTAGDDDWAPSASPPGRTPPPARHHSSVPAPNPSGGGNTPPDDDNTMGNNDDDPHGGRGLYGWDATDAWDAWEVSGLASDAPSTLPSALPFDAPSPVRSDAPTPDAPSLSPTPAPDQCTPHSPGGCAFLAVAIPEVALEAGVDNVVSLPFTEAPILSLPGFTAFAAQVLKQPSVQVVMVGPVQVSVPLRILGVTFFTMRFSLQLRRLITVPGADGFPAVAVSGFSLAGSTASSVQATITTTMVNGAPISLWPLGLLAINVRYRGRIIGEMVSTNPCFALIGGGASNSLNFTGRLFTHQNPSLASDLVSAMLMQQPLPVEVRGNGSFPGTSPLFAGIISRGITMKTVVSTNGSAALIGPDGLVPFIEVAALTLDLDKATEAAMNMTMSAVLGVVNPLGASSPIHLLDLGLNNAGLFNQDGEFAGYFATGNSSTVRPIAQYVLVDSDVERSDYGFPGITESDQDAKLMNAALARLLPQIRSMYLSPESVPLSFYSVDLSGTLNITNPEALSVFVRRFVNQRQTTFRIDTLSTPGASAFATFDCALGRIEATAPLNATMVIPGAVGFSPASASNIMIIGEGEGRGADPSIVIPYITVSINVTLFNPSVVVISLGEMTFLKVMAGSSVVGYGQATNMTLLPNSTAAVTVTGHLCPQGEPTAMAAISKIFTSFLSHKTTNLSVSVIGTAYRGWGPVSTSAVPRGTVSSAGSVEGAFGPTAEPTLSPSGCMFQPPPDLPLHPGPGWLDSALADENVTAEVIPAQDFIPLTDIAFDKLTLDFATEASSSRILTSGLATAFVHLPATHNITMRLPSLDATLMFSTFDASGMPYGALSILNATGRIEPLPLSVQSEYAVSGTGTATAAVGSFPAVAKLALVFRNARLTPVDRLTFEQFITSAMLNKTIGIGFAGYSNAVLQLNIGSIDLRGLYMKSSMKLAGLGGLQTPPVEVVEANAISSTSDSLGIETTLRIFNPSNITMLIGTVYALIYQGTCVIAAATVPNLELVPGSNQVLANGLFTIPSHPGPAREAALGFLSRFLSGKSNTINVTFPANQPQLLNPLLIPAFIGLRFEADFNGLSESLILNGTLSGNLWGIINGSVTVANTTLAVNNPLNLPFSIINAAFSVYLCSDQVSPDNCMGGTGLDAEIGRFNGSSATGMIPFSVPPHSVGISPEYEVHLLTGAFSRLDVAIGVDILTRGFIRAKVNGTITSRVGDFLSTLYHEELGVRLYARDD